MAEQIKAVAAVISSLLVIIGFIVSVCKIYNEYRKSVAGQLCLLRAEMLRIYYNNKDRKVLRQYEAQNFMLMYEAYESRGGNSFIKEVRDHVTSWEIET